MSRAGTGRQDRPADRVLTPREPGHHSPLHGGATLGLEQVRLTEGTADIRLPTFLPAATACSAEWFREISGSNVAGANTELQGGIHPPDPGKAQKQLLCARLMAGEGAQILEYRA